MNKKFLFENSFDDVPNVVLPEEKAEPVFTKTQLDQAVAQAMAEGQAAGMEQAKQSLEKLTLDACGQIAQQMQMLLSNYGAEIEEITQKSTGLVLFSLQKILPPLLLQNSLGQIENVVRQCFEFALEAPKLTLKVHPDVESAIEKSLLTLIEQNGFNGKIMLQSDPSLTQGDCRIEWGQGGLEAMPSESWRKIEELLKQSLPAKAAASIPENTSQS